MKELVRCRTLLALIVLGTLSACATSGGAGDKTMIRSTLESWRTAVKAGNVDQMMALYSEKYKDYSSGDKASARKTWAMLAEQDFLKNAEVSLENMEISIKEDTAFASPVDFGTTAMGYLVMEFALAREDGAWRIISVQRY